MFRVKRNSRIGRHKSGGKRGGARTVSSGAVQIRIYLPRYTRAAAIFCITLYEGLHIFFFLNHVIQRSNVSQLLTYARNDCPGQREHLSTWFCVKLYKYVICYEYRVHDTALCISNCIIFVRILVTSATNLYITRPNT